MKLKEIRLKPDDEIKKILAEKRDNARELKFKIASKQHKNHHDLKQARQDIARMLTVMKERQLIKSREQESSNQGKK